MQFATPAGVKPAGRPAGRPCNREHGTWACGGGEQQSVIFRPHPVSGAGAHAEFAIARKPSTNGSMSGSPLLLHQRSAGRHTCISGATSCVFLKPRGILTVTSLLFLNPRHVHACECHRASTPEPIHCVVFYLQQPSAGCAPWWTGAVAPGAPLASPAPPRCPAQPHRVRTQSCP